MNDRVLTLEVLPNGVIHSSLHGAITAAHLAMLDEDIRTGHAAIEAAHTAHGAPLQSLINLSDFSGTYVPKALSMLAAYMKSNKPFIRKSAGYGAGPTTTLAANIVASLAGRDDIYFFKSKEEALTWLSKSDAPTPAPIIGSKLTV